jgi:hypothetical protein
MPPKKAPQVGKKISIRSMEKQKIAPVKKDGAKNPVGAPRMTDPRTQSKDKNKYRKKKRIEEGRRYNSLSISSGIHRLVRYLRFHLVLFAKSKFKKSDMVYLKCYFARCSAFRRIHAINRGTIPPSGARRGAGVAAPKAAPVAVQKADPGPADRGTVLVQLVGKKLGT